jgi:hypothetical protein
MYDRMIKQIWLNNTIFYFMSLLFEHETGLVQLFYALVSMITDWSIYLSIYVPIYLPTYLFIYLPTHPPTYLPIYLSLSTYLPIYLPIRINFNYSVQCDLQ